MSLTNLDDDQPIVVFSDSFEVSTWNGLWVEDSQNDWFRSTQRASDGNYSAEVDGSARDATLTLSNSVDLTPYGSAELTFSWFIESSFDSGEYLALDLFDGTTWNEVTRLRGNVDQENVWHQESIEINETYLVNNFKARIRAKASRSNEDANVDDVQLIATSLAGPPNQAPTITTTAVTTATEDLPYTYDVDASDPDAGDTLNILSGYGTRRDDDRRQHRGHPVDANQRASRIEPGNGSRARPRRAVRHAELRHQRREHKRCANDHFHAGDHRDGRITLQLRRRCRRSRYQRHADVFSGFCPPRE